VAYESLKELAKLYRAAKLEPESRGIRLEYGVMMCIAAAQTLALNAKTMTVIEFGVYKGDGLLALADFCRQIQERTGLEFRLFGFDSGAGLPRPSDYRDHPEIWREGDFVDVDYGWLARQLPSFGQLMIGGFTETVPEFCKNALRKDAPISFVSIDSDLYTSATHALKLFESDSEFFIPSPLVYFDDVDDIITFNGRCGEALAIAEFNERNSMRLIQRKRSDMHGYFACHILDHPVRQGRGGHGTFDIRVGDF
jgi:hypothetical protein